LVNLRQRKNNCFLKIEKVAQYFGVAPLFFPYTRLSGMIAGLMLLVVLLAAHSGFTGSSSLFHQK